MTTSPFSLPCGALVTGAGRRIGRAIALRLAGEGFAVAVHTRHSVVEAEAVVEQIRAAGGRAAVVRADLENQQDVEGLVGAARAAVGPLGVLVNNASLFEPDEVGSLRADLWERHFAVHVRAPVFLAQAFAGQFEGDMRGVVVNLIDQRVWKLTPQFFSYTLSKAALHTATQTLAQALAPRVRVVGIGPGPTLANTRQNVADFTAQQAELPLGEGPDPEDIADTLVFLLRASHITGQMIAVDGGQHLMWRTADVAGVKE